MVKLVIGGKNYVRTIACVNVEDEPSDVEISSEDDEPKPEKRLVGTQRGYSCSK